MKLEDLKIIITGGAQGMGRHFALRLAEAGAQVAVGDVNEVGLAETLEAGKTATKGKIHARRLNVADEADVASFVAWAHGAMGGLNGLVNNAGILRDGLLVKKDRETGAVKVLSKEQWDAVIGVNLTGATLITRDVVAKMVETNQRPGVIVNISSIARHGNRGQSNYTAAKAALAANTVTWSQGVRGVRRSRRRRRPRHDRDPDDPGHEPEGARRARRRHPGRPDRPARRTSGWP